MSIKIFKGKYAILFYLSIIGSCTYTNINSESDKNEAQAVVDSFYNIMKSKAYSKSFNLFSDAFLKVSDTTQILSYIRKVDSSCGAPISYEVSDWNTKIIRGTRQSAQYYFVNSVKREKCISQETIALIKQDGKIQIASYDVKINIPIDAL